ncbi:MAG TPA: cell division protein ZapB [Deltaproteobacteria bacterium]|nr:cell division protein ZapB [Deltaproteobacteria bacterium]
MVESGKFDQLEAKIKQVVDRCVELKKQLAEQDEVILAKDRELREANATIRALQEDKDAVRVKVESLLEKLDALELPS